MVASKYCLPGASGKYSHQQTHRRATVAAIERAVWLRQAVPAFAFDNNRLSVVIRQSDGNAKLPQAVECRERIGSAQKIFDARGAVCNGAEYRGAMRNGFVAGNG